MGQIPLEVGWDDEIDQLWDLVVEVDGEATAIQAMQRAIQTVPLQATTTAPWNRFALDTGPHSKLNCGGYSRRTDGWSANQYSTCTERVKHEVHPALQSRCSRGRHRDAA